MCGIFGIINKKPRKFDYATFCTLGCVNDSRGGDSCGIFIDGQVEYGTGATDKYFGNYFTKSKLLNETKEATIALGHCRKASVGGVGIGDEKAQPVVLRDEQGNVKFVVIHNGTIHNYLDLAKKYIPEIDVKDMTDSQVMARIFYYKGFDVLAEYNGGAVFVVVDYREDQPKVYFWKGVSKKSEYPVNAAPEEERPFTFVEHNGSFVFSSLPGLIPALRRGCGTVYTMFDNCLSTFTEEKGLVQLKKYDRSKMTQNKAYTSTYSGGGTGTTYTGGSTSRSSSSTGSTTSSSKSKKNREDLSTGILLQKATTNLYTRKSKLVHGKAILSNAGRFVATESKDTKCVWFYQGIPLNIENGMSYFRFLEYLRKKSNLGPEEFVKKFENAVRYLSFDRLFFKDDVLMRATSADTCELFSGTFHMIGNLSGAKYSDGKPDYTTGNDSSSANGYEIPFNLQKKEAIENINLVELRETCISLMK